MYSAFRTSYLKLLLIIIFMFLVLFMYAQIHKTENHPLRIGLNVGSGTQENFLFKSANYNYETKFYKFQINYQLNNPKKDLKLALNVEPSIYKSKYYPFYETTMSRNHNQEKPINDHKEVQEFSINIGFQAKTKMIKNISAYILGSIGPTFSNTETDRLNSGMSFSDIIALGLNYDTSYSQVDLRLSFRHVSNAGLNRPNKGYNSLNFEVGFTLPVNL